MSDPMIEHFKDLLITNLHLYQGVIREKNISNIVPEVEITPDISRNPLFQSIIIPNTPAEKIDKFLLTIAKKAEANYGQTFKLGYVEDSPWAYARDSREFLYLLKAMDERAYFSISAKANSWWTIRLSLEAWDRIHELRQGGLGSRQGFVACWFDDQHETYRLAMEQGIHEAGYLPYSIKEKHFSETILEKALGEIRRSRFVVVDLTEQRSTVFVEMGFAMGLGIETILVIKSDYWDLIKKQKRSLEFYASNYSIKKYKDAAMLENIVYTSIGALIGYSNIKAA